MHESDNGELQIQYDEQNGAYHVDFDREKLSPILAIVKAVGRITDSEPLDLPPLAEELDIDLTVLDLLSHSDRSGAAQHSASVTSHYLGYRITVCSGGSLEIESLEDD